MYKYDRGWRAAQSFAAVSCAAGAATQPTTGKSANCEDSTINSSKYFFVSAFEIALCLSLRRPRAKNSRGHSRACKQPCCHFDRFKPV